MIAITILYRQILVLTYTEIALTLGFLLYFPPVTVFLTHTLFTDFEEPLEKRMKTNLLSALVFSVIILFFYLFLCAAYLQETQEAIQVSTTDTP